MLFLEDVETLSAFLWTNSLNHMIYYTDNIKNLILDSNNFHLKLVKKGEQTPDSDILFFTSSLNPVTTDLMAVDNAWDALIAERFFELARKNYIYIEAIDPSQVEIEKEMFISDYLFIDAESFIPNRINGNFTNLFCTEIQKQFIHKKSILFKILMKYICIYWENFLS